MKGFPHPKSALHSHLQAVMANQSSPLLKHCTTIKTLTLPFSSKETERDSFYIQPHCRLLADTKMKMPQLLILLLTIFVQVGAGFPADRGTLMSQSKHASWDDVNVVAHGLLQLGQALKEHVDKTKAQMRDVNAKLNAFNGTVAELERKQREQNEALKARGREVGEEEGLEGELTREVKVKVEEVKKQSEDVRSRLEKLEERVDGVQVGDSNNSDHLGVSNIQVREKILFLFVDIGPVWLEELLLIRVTVC